MTNGSNQQRRFETKLNLNLFKDIEKRLYKKTFCLFFLFFFETFLIKANFLYQNTYDQLIGKQIKNILKKLNN